MWGWKGLFGREMQALEDLTATPLHLPQETDTNSQGHTDMDRHIHRWGRMLPVAGMQG